MKRTNPLLTALALASMPCWAGAEDLKKLFQTMLASSQIVPSQTEFFSAVNENTVLPLSAQEVNELLPLAKRALESPKEEIGQYGASFFMAVGFRPDSLKLLEPYVDDLGALANAPKTAQSLRHGIIYVLGMTQPSVIPEAVPYLLRILENESTSIQDTGMSASALLRTFPTDRAVIDRVLNVARIRSDVSLTIGVVSQFGLMKSRDPQALSLIGSSLDSGNAGIRRAAVEAAGRIDRDVRTKFAGQLGRIAADDKESPELRSMASAALGR